MSFPVKSARPSLPPPVPTTPVPEPRDGEPAARAHAVQLAVAQQYQAWRDAHPADIDPDVLKANAGAFAHSPATQQLSPALKAVEQDVDAASRKVADAIANTRVAPENETRAQRVWNNAVRLLDAKTNPSEIASAARELVENAGDDLPVYVESLGGYLESRNVPTGWLPEAFAAAIPGLAEARDAGAVKAKQLGILRSNHERLTHAIEKDVDAPALFSPATVTAAPYSNPAQL